MRFVIYHKEKGYFMNGSSHLRDTERFSPDLQEAKIFATRAVAKGAITSHFTRVLVIANPTFHESLEIVPVKLALVEE